MAAFFGIIGFVVIPEVYNQPPKPLSMTLTFAFADPCSRLALS